MMSIRRFALAGLVALGLGGGSALLSAAPSLAALGYTASPSAVFGTAGSGNGELSEPIGVAVDEATGEVYVADTGNNRVEQFDASGKYLGQWGGGETPAGSFSGPNAIAVDNSSSATKGDVYVSDFGNHVVDVFTAAGKYITQVKRAEGLFRELQGVAVGASGEVWVYDGAVSEFSNTGVQLAEFGTGRGFGPGLAVDSAGGVYVLFGSGGVGKFRPTSASSAQQVGEWGGEGTALAVNLASDNVFLDQADQIQEYQPFGEPSGSVVETFGTAGLTGSQGLAIDDGDGTIYATQRSAGSVAVFDPVLLAGVSTGPASSVEKTAATISGTVSREGLPTKYRFEYGETNAYGSSTATTDAVGEEEEVTATLSGLAPGTTYHYRLVAENSNGTSPGVDRTFKTGFAVDSVRTEAASAVGKAGATLNGSLAPDGTDAHYYFEYGPYQGYGSTSPAPPGIDAGSASKDEHVEVALEGLLPSTTYHYRIVAVNSLGTTYGEDAEFTTQPAVDGVLTEGASSVSATGATFNGSLSPDGTDAHYYFEYGENPSYGSTSPALPGTDAGSETKPEHAEASVTGLQALTTYHYRIVAVNSFGTTYGEDRTVATLGAAPAVDDQPPAVSNILRASALVVATINSENSPTVFHAEFVAAGAYAPGAANPYADGGSSQSYEVPAAHGDRAIRPLPLTGLLPSTTYHYRLVATNATGTTYGPDYTFTTAAATPPGVQANEASAVTQTTATLSGTVEAEGLQTSYEFEVGVDTTYSGAKLFGNAGQSAGSEAVSASLQFLVPGTTYHYRLVATNADGTTYGPDMTFTTPGVPALIAQPLATQLIPNPAVQFPSDAGAITQPQGSVKSSHKAKKKAKPRRRAKHKRSTAKHKRSAGKHRVKKGGKRGK